MKVSRDKVDDNRRAILAAAGRLFRELGFEAVTIAQVMQAAALTHGAFYGYFRSKEDLIAATLAELLDAPPAPGRWTESAARYLSPAHRDDCAGGCPVAALGSELVRQSPQAREAAAAGLERTIARLSASAPGETPPARRQAAIGAWAAMVGAVILSRAVADPSLSEEVLASTLAWLEERGPPTQNQTG